MDKEKFDKMSADEQVEWLLHQEPTIKMSKESLKELLSNKKASYEFLEYLDGLENLEFDFTVLMKTLQGTLKSFQEMHPQQLTVAALFRIEGDCVHGEPKPTSHFLSNIGNDDEESKQHVIEVFFNNCRMSKVFRDIIVGTYMCCKKLGIDTGDYQTLLDKNVR